MLCIYTAGLTTRGLFLVSMPDSRTAIESVGSAFASRHATTRPVVPPILSYLDQNSPFSIC